MMRIGRLAAALLAWIALEGCMADGPLSGGRVSTVTMRYLTPATEKWLSVEVTGPGISPAMVGVGARVGGVLVVSFAGKMVHTSHGPYGARAA
jgi:hypothetical protein